MSGAKMETCLDCNRDFIAGPTSDFICSKCKPKVTSSKASDAKMDPIEYAARTLCRKHEGFDSCKACSEANGSEDELCLSEWKDSVQEALEHAANIQPALLAALKAVEWVALPLYDDGSERSEPQPYDIYLGCPECEHSQENDHAHDCQLNAAIQLAGG